MLLIKSLKHPNSFLFAYLKFCLYLSSKPWQVFAAGWLLRKQAQSPTFYTAFLVMLPFRTCVHFPRSMAFEFFASYMCKSLSSNSPDHLEMERIGVMLNISQWSFHFRWGRFRVMGMF